MSCSLEIVGGALFDVFSGFSYGSNFLHSNVSFVQLIIRFAFLSQVYPLPLWFGGLSPFFCHVFLMVLGHVPWFFTNKAQPFSHEGSHFLGGHCINIHCIQISFFLLFFSGVVIVSSKFPSEDSHCYPIVIINLYGSFCPSHIHCPRAGPGPCWPGVDPT